ncbi:hypothetical protein BSL78_20620 [Apostichopus japonicus]|uniref:Uncharacterized protein n=1 Tax=Stichopus japonicus TaxID=307972 RepID=A0A2G8K3C8_STIJA|nr:hypothetical protein BSL78_20620 [Apostichopus japonicus]
MFGVYVFLYVLLSCYSAAEVIPSLRSARNVGTVARFPVSREALEAELRRLEGLDDICGDEVNLRVAEGLPRDSYDQSQYAEVTVTYQTITDRTLEAEMCNTLRDSVSTESRYMSIAMPFVSDKRHGLLSLAIFSNDDKTVMVPFDTNRNAVQRIDSIEENNDGTVTFRKGDDVMVLVMQHDAGCQSDALVEDDFNVVYGEHLTMTNYPAPFDWGCDILQSATSFCQVLADYRCQLNRVNGDVCTVSSNGASKRCSAKMSVQTMTGFFRNAAPFLADMTPTESFEAEWIDREHDVGLQFPCFTP